MAYGPEHPLGVLSKELGYSGAASLQACLHRVGYDKGWDKLEVMRAYAAKHLNSRSSKSGPRTEANGVMRTSLVPRIAKVIFPNIQSGYAKQKIRNALHAAGLAMPWKDEGQVLKILGEAGMPVHLYKPAGTSVVPVVAAPVAPSPSAVTVDLGAESLLPSRAHEAGLLLQKVHDVQVDRLRKNRSRKIDPLIGLAIYSLGVLRGEV